MNTMFYKTLDDFLGDRASRFFGGGYKNTDLRIHSVQICGESSSLSAMLDIDIAGGWSSHHGNERRYHLSNVEALVVAGQSVQALLYWLDGLRREEVDNLWIRGLSIVNTRPIERYTDIPVHVACKEFLTASVRGEPWRHASLDITIDANALAIKNYKACYRLPLAG